MSPELAEAYHKFWDTYWNHCGTMEGPEGYSMLTYAEVIALDEAAGTIEKLLTAGNAKNPGQPPSPEGPEG